MFPFTVLSHPTSDIKHPTLLLHTSQGTRYLFGKVPEGLQRSLNEQKKRLSKVAGVFLTGELDWESVGGLPGLILTISDQGKKDLNLYYGTTFLNYVVSTWRSFVFRFGMKVGSNVIPNGQTYNDNVMSVQSVVLKKSIDVPDLPFSQSVSDKLKQIVSRMFPLDVKNIYTDQENEDFENQQSDPKLTYTYIHVKLPDISKHQTSTSYIIQLNKLRGKFLAEKAVALGIPNGKLRGQLASGSEITLPNGTVVKPEEVLSEERYFQKILIIDIPSKDYFPSAKEVQWGNDVGIIYHFLGEDLEPFEQPYLEFIKSFGSDTQHYISHPLYSPDSIVFKSHAELTLKLKALHIKHFNLPRSSNPIKSLPEDLDENIKPLLQGQVMSIECTPKAEKNHLKLDDSEVVLQTGDHWEDSYADNVIELDPIYKKEDILSLKTISSLSVDPDVPLKDQIETITLGTGSALPSKYRNVISTLVRIPFNSTDNQLGYKSILLDAGENTIGSLRRSLGNENLPIYFKELKLIYLSHLHADHHLGIITIIKEWLKQNEDNNEKLYLVTPWQYNRFVNEWMKFDAAEALDRLSYISCESFLSGRLRNEVRPVPFEDFSVDSNIELTTVDYQRNYDLIRDLFKDVGIKRFLTCRAIHCDWAYSCAITFMIDSTATFSDSNSFKVSYSGDTRPNYFMFSEKIGQHSDLLIHEATLENDLIEEAKKKRHSTINEAILVSNKMNAKKLILTHFSQRYPHLPKISDHLKVNADYCIAFDLMVNKYSEIGDQLEIMEQLNTIFSPEKFADDMDED